MMTTLAINYIVNPFLELLKSVKYGFEMAGMMRAARELRRMGYEKEYNMTIDRMRKMQSEG
jgi:hypothetical protein